MSSKVDALAKIIWDFNTNQPSIQTSDILLVLGSNDVRVAKRGAELFFKNYAPVIIFSGNVGRLSKDLFDKPEAEIFADIAVKMGVPESKILIENKSTNTGENIAFTQQLLKDKGLDPQSFIIVQKPYMLKRAYGTFKKYMPNKILYLAAPQISYENYPNDVITRDHIINMMVGDLQRLKIYPEKGFQIPVAIPNSVWNAYEELVALGFTKNLIV